MLKLGNYLTGAVALCTTLVGMATDTTPMKTLTEWRADLTPTLQQAQAKPSTDGINRFWMDSPSQEPVQSIESKQILSLLADKWLEGTVAQQPSVKRSARVAAAAKVHTGNMITKDRTSTGNSTDHYCINVQGANGVYSVSSIFGVGDPISMNVNEAEGTVSITPQVLFTHTTYGEVWLCSMDLVNKYYSTTTPLTGTIDSEGKITLGSWGIVIVAGQYAGNAFAVYNDSEWVPSNATISITDVNGETETYGSLIEQAAANQITFYNFAGNGTPVSGTVTTDGSIKVPPQYISYNAMYGDLYCYAYDSAGKVSTSLPIVGTVSSSTISFGSWCVTVRGYTNMMYLGVKTCTVTLSEGTSIKIPEAIAPSFEGDGTAASPYQISTPAQFEMLAQAVNNGNSYTGKSFIMTADMDMSQAGSAYTSIGEETAMFNGKFDGNGHTIKNLTINGLGFNNIGLFGALGQNAEVSNITLTACSITGSGTNIGLIAGYNQGIIKNCTVQGSIVSTGLVSGGIAGHSEGLIENCSFNGDVSNYGSVGGIAGSNYGTISKCSTIGNIAVTGYLSSQYCEAGGIAGSSGPKGTTGGIISDCYVAGQVADQYGRANVGGIVGMTVLAKTERCFNVATLQGKRINQDYDTALGGIVGLTSESEFSDCFNAGNIIKTDQSESVGGLAGYLLVVYVNGSVIERQSHFYNCYNSGQVVTTSAELHRGLFGTTFYYEASGIDPLAGVFNNCYFDSQLSGIVCEPWGQMTSFFNGGQLPAGFSPATWTAKAGAYPTLKGFEDTAASALAVSHPVLSDNENITKIKKAFKLNTTNGVIFKLFGSNAFVDETTGLKITGNNVELKDAYSNELLVALLPDGSGYKMWNIAIVPNAFDGEGTAQSPYLIKNVNDFKQLDTAVSTYKQAHAGDYFRMTADIDFEYTDDFRGIGAGSSTAAFGGVFDGNGHSIKRLKIHSAAKDATGQVITSGSYNFAGLFGICSETSVIKNLTIAADCDLEFFGRSAAIAGVTYGRIEGCANFAPINGVYESVAGIAALTSPDAVVSGCYNAGPVTIGSSGAGGIVSENYGLIELCQNDGPVSATVYSNYVNSTNKTKAGGVCAWNYGTIDRCVNNAKVTASKDVGGMTAVNSTAANGGHMTACVNTGYVDCIDAAETRGGMIGCNYGTGTVTANYYDATLNTFGSAGNGALPGITGMTAAALTSGTLPDALNAEDWSVATDKYPSLALFASMEATEAYRSMVVAFDGNNNRNNVMNTTSLHAPAGSTWTVSQNDNFKVTDGKLTVTVPTDMEIATDTLTCSVDGKYIKTVPVKALPILFDGAGTAENPYLIPDADTWNKLADFVATTHSDFSGISFKMTADIEFPESTFKPIAYDKDVFQGTFDGNGHTIKPNYKNTTTTLGRYIGMFGTVGAAGSVRNLTAEGTFDVYSYSAVFVGKLYGHISNCKNRAAVTTSNAGYAAGLVYKAFQGAVIEDCVNEGNVSTKTTYAAGIVADTEKETIIRNCSNSGTIMAGPTSPTQNYAAGIAGILTGTVTGCRNSGQIMAKQYAAGIVAQAKLGITIEDCHNTGEISSTGTYAAGIVATTTAKNTGVIKGCTNTASITATGNAAGIAGTINSGHTVENCWNTGNITSTSSNNTAGIIGNSSSAKDYPNYFINCWNTAPISAVGQYAAGIGGSFSSDYNYMTDCWNTGDITSTYAKTSSSGVAGVAGSFTGEATHCWNAGNVTCAGFGVSGFAGLGSGTLTECFNLGDVTSTYTGTPGANFSGAAGLWSQGANHAVNCYNMGNITANDRAAGLCGAMWKNASLSGCYNAGKVTITGSGKSDVDALYSFRNGADATTTTINGCFYDATVNAHLPESAKGKALTTAEMFETDADGAFITAPASYPRIEAFADNARANFAAAQILLNGTDTPDNVTAAVTLATLPDVEWAASEHFELTEGTATPQKAGEATITATALDGQLSKSFLLTVTHITTGIDGINADSEIVNRIYYTIDGVQVAEPSAADGRVYVVIATYADGTVRSFKVVNK